MGIKLGNICRFQSGGTPSKGRPEFFNGTIPWITTTALNGGNIGKESAVDWISEQAIKESAAKIVPAFSVMVGTRVGVGKVAINTTNMSTSQDIVALLDIDESIWSKAFLCKFLQAKGTFLKAQARGATIKGIKIDVLSELELPEIPIEEQQHISQIIDKVKATIAIRQSQLQKLDELVKVRFVELFGDPISNPKGWKKDKAENHIDLLSGYPFQSEQYVNDGINICGGLIIMPQKIQWQDCKHWPSVDGYEDYLLAEDDIVLALDRPWISEGFKIAQVDSTHLPALLIQRTARIRGIDVNQQYLFHCFVNGGFDKHSNVTGSLVPHISAKDIRSFEILLPPIKLQKQFAAFVKQVDKSKFCA